MAQIPISATCHGSSRVEAKLAIAPLCTSQHLSAARLFRDDTAELERTERDDSKWSRHRAYATAAVLSSAAAMEAFINEFYWSAATRRTEGLGSLDVDTIERLKQVWKKVDRPPILPKYQEALKAAGYAPLDEQKAPFVDANLLRLLRNALVHYKPELDTSEEGYHYELKIKLNGKFALSRWASEKNAWFPHQCLGAGCAAWAVDSAAQLIQEFSRRMGIPPRI